MSGGTIAFRAGASAAMGTGHLMRCLTLADALAELGLQSMFVGYLAGFEVRILERGHGVTTLPAPEGWQAAACNDYSDWLPTSELDDASAFAAAVEEAGVSVVVVDHYALGAKWERAVARETSARVFAIDDLKRAHASDAILDTTFGRLAADYAGSAEHDPIVLCGSRYALLRPGFARLRAASIERLDRGFARNAPVDRLLISLGGADPANVTTWVLNAIATLDPASDLPNDLQIHVLLGPAFAAHSQVRAAAADLPRPCTVHEDVDDVASLLATTDLCVGASGSSAWERCCLAVPTVNVVTAANQRDVADALVSAGAVAAGGTFEDVETRPEPATWARQVFAPLLVDAARRKALSLAAREVADGLGAGRAAAVASALAANVGLRELLPEDGDLVFRWQSYPQTRRYSRNPTSPSRQQHDHWMRARLDHGEPNAWIITFGSLPAGLIRLDDGGGQDAEVSILIDPDMKRRGIAAAALRLLPHVAPRARYLAEIDPANAGSCALFKSVGFHRDRDDGRIWHWTGP